MQLTDSVIWQSFSLFSGHNGTGGPESVDESNIKSGSNWQCPQEAESFKNGFSECVAETVHFLVEKEHIPPENPLCARLVNHLKRHLEQKPGLASAAAAGSPVAGSGASGADGNGSNATNMGEVSNSFSRNGSSINRLRRYMDWVFKKVKKCADVIYELFMVPNHYHLEVQANPKKNGQKTRCYF